MKKIIIFSIMAFCFAIATSEVNAQRYECWDSNYKAYYKSSDPYCGNSPSIQRTQQYQHRQRESRERQQTPQREYRNTQPTPQREYRNHSPSTDYDYSGRRTNRTRGYDEIEVRERLEIRRDGWSRFPQVTYSKEVVTRSRREY